MHTASHSAGYTIKCTTNGLHHLRQDPAVERGSVERALATQVAPKTTYPAGSASNKVLKKIQFEQELGILASTQKSLHTCSLCLHQWRVPHFALKYPCNPPPPRESVIWRPFAREVCKGGYTMPNLGSSLVCGQGDWRADWSINVQSWLHSTRIPSFVALRCG